MYFYEFRPNNNDIETGPINSLIMRPTEPPLVMSEGVLYLATGEQYINEARRSAQSVRDHMPDTDIALITDEQMESDLFDVVKIEQSLRDDFSSSNLHSGLSPFDRTLFLDTDTYVCDDVSELFDILDDFDIAIAPTLSEDKVLDVPRPWTQYNTGVIAYKKNERTDELLSLWNEIYNNWRKNRNITKNQESFLKAVYESDVNLFKLSYNYNTRLFCPGGIHGEAKIVHGRPQTGIENAAELINRSSRFRAFYPNSYLSKSSAFKLIVDGSLRYHFEKSIVERGMLDTIFDIPRYIRERLL